MSTAVTATSTLYIPQDGATYYFEAQHNNVVWPECNYRFVSYPSTCDMVDLWQDAGVNQEITLLAVDDEDGVNTWRLETNCGTSIGYSTSCGNTDIGTNGITADSSDVWRLVSTGNFAEWNFEAVNRSDCQDKFITFNSDCNMHALALGDNNRDFLMHPVSASADNPTVHHIATSNSQGCADPFVWKDPDDTAGNPYKMICTGGNIPLYSSPKIGRKDSFTYEGPMLGNRKPNWASDSNRWAPENTPLGDGKNLAIFSSPQSNGVHRMGVVLSIKGAKPRAWNTYSSNILALPNTEGGEIDAHFFKDGDKTYVLWKTDDNDVGAKYTRLWIQEVSISLEDEDLLQLVGEPVMILDSTGLWWIDSWVDGGSLIEGPQLMKHGIYYYLFFASGKYCQLSYSQGVARSTSIFGPYSKLGVPLLSTGTVGIGSNGDKLIGPGHASFIQDETGSWFSIFHASEGLNCNRYSYVERLQWTDDYWPVVVTNPIIETPAPTPPPVNNNDNGDDDEDDEDYYYGYECEDDATFKWVNKKGKTKKCKWFAKKNKCNAKRKHNGKRQKVFNFCPFSCNKC